MVSPCLLRPARLATLPAPHPQHLPCCAAGGAPHLLVALLASACVATSAGPAAAAPPAELFAPTCAGCHAGGGNIVQRDATLQLEDLQRRGLADVESLYAVIYGGRGRMPGYGADCAPKLQVGAGRAASASAAQDGRVVALQTLIWCGIAGPGWQGSRSAAARPSAAARGARTFCRAQQRLPPWASTVRAWL